MIDNKNENEKSKIKKHFKLTTILLIAYYLIGGIYKVIQTKMNGGVFVMSEIEVSITYLIAFLLFLKLIIQTPIFKEDNKI